jgi:hypothetical protein
MSDKPPNFNNSAVAKDKQKKKIKKEILVEQNMLFSICSYWLLINIYYNILTRKTVV